MERTVNHPSPAATAVLSYRRMGLFMLLSILALAAPVIAQAQPITSDSRIKTFVYNPNEVFSITTHYGYQSNVEFGPKETIDTISVGDRVAWQIIPAGRRLFIRSMEENARTNMTVVTNQRAYQFDLRSSSADAVFGSEELTYVVRFFYPTEAQANGAVYVPSIASITPPAPVVSAPPPAPAVIPPAPAAAPAKPAKTAAAPAPAKKAASTPAPVATSKALPPEPLMPLPPVNYKYTFSGPNDIAPTKIYDDGKTTYFKLPPAADMPKFFIVTAKGESIDTPARRTTDGLLAVDAVAPRFRLSQAGRDVIIYNEAGEV